MISGLGGNDVIDGLGGKDILCGGDGNDTINGGSGADTINGGDGDDTIFGEAGPDDINGGKGKDNIDGGDGNDVILGGGAGDTILGGAGKDNLKGGYGFDTIMGGGGDDVIRGGGAGDTILGGTGKDDLRGGPGDDVIKGEADDDFLDGGDGNDTLFGGAGSDDLRGSGGNDTLDGKAGADALRGGAGDDALLGGADDDVLAGQDGIDSLDGSDGIDDCEGETEFGCEQDLIDFHFDRFYISQAVPSADTDDIPADQIEPVKGRSGLVRTFFTANRFDTRFEPTVKLHWRKAGGAKGSVKLTGPTSLKLNAPESDLSKTHNYVFDDSFLKPGMSFYVEVDGGDKFVESDETNNRYPASGWFDPNVISVPKLKITFVPIRLDGGSPPTVTQASALGLLEDTIDVHPIAEVNIKIHGAIDYNTTGTFSDWTNMLQQVRDLGLNEDPGRAYAGIVSFDPSGVGVAGIGYVNGPGFTTWPYSVSIPSPSMIAHELGHNFSLPHALCSGAESNPDLNYPYNGGKIGTWGYESDSGVLKDPAVFRDLMTYCNKEWISDYNFQNVLDFRNSTSGFDLLDVPAGSSSVSFSGVLEGHEPSVFRVPGVGAPGAALDAATTAATSILVPQGGDLQVVGLDAAGSVVVSASFTAYVVEDTLQLSEIRHFAFSLPLLNGDLAAIVRWEVLDSIGLVTSADVG